MDLLHAMCRSHVCGLITPPCLEIVGNSDGILEPEPYWLDKASGVRIIGHTSIYVEECTDADFRAVTFCDFAVDACHQHCSEVSLDARGYVKGSDWMTVRRPFEPSSCFCEKA